MTLRTKATLTSLTLSALFLIVYSSCNIITSLRPNIGSFYFAWERHIPFIPALILPYMSIDLFFLAAPFLATSELELRTFARRITAAILIAGLFFLLFPLKFAFDRPPVPGLLGLIFNNFRTLDLPFNEFPSLHITLWAILLDLYLRHTKNLPRLLLILWFTLIFLSTILTYQHHTIDILGGLILALLCFHFIQDQPLRQPFRRTPRIAAYYVFATLLLTLLAFTYRPWTYLFLYPALSLALVALAHLFLGPGLFRKQHGHLNWTTKILLFPILLGQHLSLLYYTRHCRAYDPLTPNLWIGRRLTTTEAQRAKSAGITAVLDLTSEFSESRPFRTLPYLQLPLLDLTAPTPAQIDEALAFIRAHANGIVYLHCKVGYSRTAVIAGACLLSTGQAATVPEALAIIRRARPTLIVRAEALAALHAYKKEGHSFEWPSDSSIQN